MEEISHQLGQIASHFTKGLHYSSLSRRQRLAALIDVHCIPGGDGLVVETSRAVVVRNDRTLRRAVLAEAVLELANVWQARAITIESRSHPHGHFAKLDRDDSLLVAKLRDARQVSREISVEHASKGEVILGLADLLAGARTDWLCGVDRAPWSVVQHRMQLRSVPPKWTEPGDAEAPGSL